PAAHAQGQEPSSVPPVDPRAHAPERLDDAPHRPPAERGVAGQGSEDVLARQRPEEEADSRSRVAQIEHAFGVAKAPQAHAGHFDAARAPSHSRAEGLQGAEGALRVLALLVALQRGSTFSQGREDGGPLRYRLVARDLRLAE